MNFNDEQNNTNGNDNSNEVKFQEYYENEGGDEKLMMTDGKNIANFQEIMDENLIKNIINRKNEINEKKDEFQNININEDNQHNDIIEDGNDKNKNLNIII
jgi:hypothetical protein